MAVIIDNLIFITLDFVSIYYLQSQDFCSDDANWGIQSQPSGDRSFTRYIKVVQEFEGEVVTSLTSTQHHGQTVLVIGTRSGKVMKVGHAGASFKCSLCL